MGLAFGKYQLVRKLGAGGMGEVFLARPKDPASQPAELVIKRILPHLTENARFLRLFLDEARVAARLSHAHIARVLELGEVDGTWFVGMEYVAGKDLREITRRAAEAGQGVPVEIACRIAIGVAAGLDYAHRAAGPTGQPLKIVHRDISPHNVLVGFDGSVKIIDFGVAKAANRATHTKTGVLKGKFPYMAPEQAEGKRIDQRVDVFALGIVLWEILAGRTLFRGKTDAATLKKVKACEVAKPSATNPGVPAELDALVLRALAKAPKDRFQCAADFRDALEDFLVSHQLNAGPERVGAYLSGLFPALIESGDLVELASDHDLDATATIDPASGATVEQRRGRSAEEGAQTQVAELGPDRVVAADTAERTVRLLAEVTQRPTNLVAQESSFIGRVAELAELHQLIRAGARLLTLLGPGGTGKTRLSIQLASQQLPSFGHGGVWFCDLTEAHDLDGVCVGVARALNVPLPPGKSSHEATTLLGQALAGRGEPLVVLDNLEQVITHAAAAVERWMRAAPKARFVATSREVLRVPHEVVFEVPPLKLPERGEAVASSEAVMLFIERAQASRPSYQLTAADEAAVAEIVRQLDGMPLAIELAAARMAVLSPAQLVQRLPRRFELLAGRSRDASARQATLKGAIDWSWQLLSAWEQAALAQIALFRGGFTAEAAEAVLDLSAWHADLAPDALTAVMTLRSKSLVRSYYPQGEETELRYGLYESIREFAREKLDQGRDEAGAAERHARYYVGLGERLSEDADVAAKVLDALALERENLYAVFQWGVAGTEGQVARRAQALRAVLALDPLLALRGPFGAHLLMIDAALDKANDLDPLLLARGYEARGKARLARWKVAEAEQDYRAMLALAQGHGAVELEGRAHYYLGATLRWAQHPDEARAEYALGLELQRRTGDRRMEARTLGNLGQMFEEEGKASEALRLYAEALELHREVGDRRFEGIILSNLGVLQQHLGMLGQAKVNYEAALAIHRELGNRRSEGIALGNLGDLHRDLGRAPQAVSFYERALGIDREVGNRKFEGLVLAGLGSVELERFASEAALVHFQQALGVLREVGDRSFEGLVLSGMAAAHANAGRLGEAEAAFAEAEAALAQAGDQGMGEALQVFRAHLDLAKGREAAREGNVELAEALEKEVAARVRRAESATPPDATHPAGGSSPADRSEDVRAALRSVRAALRAG